jgi:hypothetical protein
MRPAKGPYPETARAGGAQVVFQHRAGPYTLGPNAAQCGTHEIVFVADEEGLLGQLEDETSFAVDLTPGRHELYVWIEARLGTSLGSPKMTVANVDFARERYVVDVVHNWPPDVLRGLDLHEGVWDPDVRHLAVDNSDLQRVTATSANWLSTRLQQGHEAALNAAVLVLRPNPQRGREPAPAPTL